MYRQYLLHFQSIRIYSFFVDCTKGSISIGDDVVISANVFIGSAHVSLSKGVQKSFRDMPSFPRDVTIGNSVFIGNGAVILPGANISNGCVIGANVVASGYYLPNSVVKCVNASVSFVADVCEI